MLSTSLVAFSAARAPFVLVDGLLQTSFSAASQPMVDLLQGILAHRTDRGDWMAPLWKWRLAHPDPKAAWHSAVVLGSVFRRNRFKADELWDRLGLREIRFCDGCGGISTVPAFMGTFLDSVPERAALLSIEEVPFTEKRAALTYFPASQGARGEPEILGRSAVYSFSDEEVFVIKYARDDQPGADLVRELRWLEKVKEIHPRSALPEPVRDRSGRAVLWTFDDGRKAIAFRAPKGPRDYYRYLDDPALSDADFLAGLRDGIHDIFLLARHGVFHTVPIALFHTTAQATGHQNRGDRGLFLLAPHLVYGEVNNPESGLGRLHNWPEALRHGNIGAGGMRDLEELATLKEILEEGAKWAPELRRLKERSNGEPLYEALLLGKSLLAATLYIGNRIARAAETYSDPAAPYWRNDARLEKYAGWLLDVFATGYAARRSISLEAAKKILNPRADWLRLSRQLAFFMTGAHAEYVSPGADPKGFPTGAIYGEGVSFKGVGPYQEDTVDERLGFVGLEGKKATLSLGPVNGSFPIREFEKAWWAMFVE